MTPQIRNFHIIIANKDALSDDWHIADIKAALEKNGWSLSRLSIANGYTRKAAANTLRKPWPKMEKIIALAIGEKAQNIWPSRYCNKGKSNRKPGRKKTTSGANA